MPAKADGIDPIEQRLKERDQRRARTNERMTFKDAAQRFIEVHERAETHVARQREGSAGLIVAALIALLVVFTGYLFIAAAPIANNMGNVVQPPSSSEKQGIEPAGE